MRAFRLVLASLLVAAGATAVAAPSAYADTVASLGVNPGHGSPDAAFTAILRWQPSKHGRNRQCQPGQVTFTWDGSVLGQAPVVEGGGACVATLRATPPPGTYDGVSAHTIGATGVQANRARYIVEASAAAATPTPEATDATPVPDTTDTAAADGQTAGPAAVGGQTGGAKATGSGSTGVSGLIVTLGLLLFLAGIATFGVLVWRARRGKTEDAGGPLPADPTQAIPMDPYQPVPVDPYQSYPADATQPIPMDATQPIAMGGVPPLPPEPTQPLPPEATRPLPLPRQPGDEQAPQAFQVWPPRHGRHSRAGDGPDDE